MDSQKAVKPLNDLLEYLYDSQNGFKEAEQQVKNQQLKNLFHSLSEQRIAMIATLKEWVKSLGGSPVESGSMIGAAHRLYVDLKSLLTGGNTKAVVNEIKRGEGTLIKYYEDTINHQDVPENIKILLHQHLSEIKNKLTQVETFSVAA